MTSLSQLFAICLVSTKLLIVYNREFYITSMKSKPVLSVSTCKELGLIKFVKTVKEETTNQFSTQIHANTKMCWEGLEKVHNTIYPDMQPVVSPPRRIPYGLDDHVKAALHEMCS